MIKSEVTAPKTNTLPAKKLLPVKKNTVQLGLLNLKAKTQKERILSSTSRKFLKDTGRGEIVSVVRKKRPANTVNSPSNAPTTPVNGTKASGFTITRREIVYLKVRIMTKKIEKSFVLDEVNDLTVRQFKAKHLKEFFEAGKYGARLIWGGKELRDSHQLNEFDLKDNPLVYIFLYNIADRAMDTRHITTMKTDPRLGVDFDYFLERNIVSEEEVAWKRFSFHGPYIYKSRIEKISDYYLFMREIQFMDEHKELRKQKAKFRGYNVGEEQGELPMNVTRKRYFVIFFVMFMIALAVGFPSIAMVRFAVSKGIRLGIIGAILLNLMLITVSSLGFGVYVLTPLQLVWRMFGG